MAHTWGRTPRQPKRWKAKGKPKAKAKAKGKSRYFSQEKHEQKSALGQCLSHWDQLFHCITHHLQKPPYISPPPPLSFACCQQGQVTTALS